MAINFGVPTAAVSNIQAAFGYQVPVVCGTTGWLDEYETITQQAQAKIVDFYMPLTLV